MTRLFFYPTREALIFGLFPRIGFSIRWRDAEDGIALIRPRFSIIKYR